MERSDRTLLRTAAIVAAIVVAAILCRNLGRILPGRSLSLLRSFLYIGLFLAWGISLRRRVMQPQVRRLATGIAALMVFWIAERTVKYFFVTDPDVVRWLWYLYYLPMLVIPLLAVFVAASLGRSERYRLPRWTRLLYLPVGALVALVLTNDLHQRVFTFPPEAAVWRDGDFTHAAGYFVVIGCMAACGLAALGVMIAKCRGGRGRRTAWLPLSFIPLSMLYGAVYTAYIEDHTSLLYYLAGDVTVALCLLFAGLLESCLQTGLIATNTGYDALFRAADVGMQIVDASGTVRYASRTAVALTGDELARAARPDGCLRADGTTLLRAEAIRGGHVVWQEDVGALLRARAELTDLRAELEERNELLRDQYRRDARRYKLEEQNRLYDLVQRETQRQLRAVDELTARYVRGTDGPETRRALLLRILVLATYLKRYKDMLVAADRSDELPLATLAAAVRESCSDLPAAGIGCNLYQTKHGAAVAAQRLLAAYACFEDALEGVLDGLRYVLVSLSRKDGVLRLSVVLDCAAPAADLSALPADHPGARAERTEDGWVVTMPLEGGGAR